MSDRTLRLADPRPPSPNERFFHTDLPELGTSQLHAEKARLRLALLFVRRADPWMVERLRRIEQELRSRAAEVNRAS